MSSRDLNLIDILVSEIASDDFFSKGPLRDCRPSDDRNE